MKLYIASSIKYIVKKEKKRNAEKIADSYRVGKRDGNNKNKRGSFEFSKIK